MNNTNTQNTPRYAGFWIRLAATIIDTILALAIILPLLYWIYGADYFTAMSNSANYTPQLGFFNVLLSYVFPIAATLIFWKYRAATPGKMLLGLIIVDVNTLQKPATFQLVIRYFSYLISIIPICLGFLWIAFDKKKQGWHDKIAGTIVVRKKSLQKREP